MRSLIPWLLLAVLAPGQGVFHTWSYGRPATLDPHLYPDPSLARLLAQVYEPPLEMELDAHDRVRVANGPFNLIGIAEEGRVLKLSARPGVRFRDAPCFEEGKGRALVAADLAFVFMRHADPGTKSTYWEPYLAGRIVGLDAWRAKTAEQGFADYEAEIEGLKVSGSILEIRLTEPYPQFLPLLTQPWASLMAPEAARRYGSGIAERPVGTGPFVLSEIDALGRVRLTRNPKYWRRGLPKLSEVIFEVMPQERHLDRFLSGDLDILFVDQAGRERFLHRGKLRSRFRKEGYRLSLSPSLELAYVVMNQKNKFLEELAVRRAISLAIDREAVAAEVYGDPGFVADSPIPQGLPEAEIFAGTSFAWGGPAPERAKELLAEAGYPDGEGLPEFVFDVPGLQPGTPSERAAKGMVADLEKVGIRAQLRAEDLGTFFQRVARGDVQLAWVLWYADYPDAENFLGLFRSTEDPVATANYGRFSDPVYDRLYDELSQMAAGPERNRVVKDAVQILRSEVPVVFLAWPRPRVLLRPEVSGFRYNVLDHGLAEVEVSTDEK